MESKIDIGKLVIVILKCFFILLFFGEVLPKCIDYMLYYMYRANEFSNNSTFVCYIVDKNIKLINNYIYIFRVFIL